MASVIALDFDGVLHAYTSGWQGPTGIPDPPVPGMAEACHALVAQGFDLVVMSSRARPIYPEGPAAIRDWLARNGFPPMEVTSEKVHADVYVDDRGFRFTGDAAAFMAFVLGDTRPWNKGGQPEAREARI